MVRIPTTNRLLTTNDFFYDCVPIAIGLGSPLHSLKLQVALADNLKSCILESGFGIVALSASTFKSLYPSFFEKPSKPVPPIPLELTEKRMSRDSDSASNSSSGTGSSSSGDSSGARVPNNTVQRKVSEEKKKGARQDA